jgi:hypothetical protein
MTIAQHIELSMTLAREVLASHMESGSLMDCAEQHDIHIQDLIEHLKFLDNLHNNQ